jgi:hypothetical protein
MLSGEDSRMSTKYPDAEPTYAKRKHQIGVIAWRIARDVHHGHVDEITVPLLLRDALNELRLHGWSPSLHSHGMKEFKKQLAMFREPN